MDIRIPNVDGIEATRVITSDPDLAAVRVLVLTTFSGSAAKTHVSRAMVKLNARDRAQLVVAYMCAAWYAQVARERRG